MAVKIKKPNEISKIQKSGSIIAQVRDLLIKNIEPGISTWELDRIAEEYPFQGFQACI